jgi:hypothetical protein
VAITTKCSECGKHYEAPDHMAGRRVRCKNCGTTFQLPAPVASAIEEDDAPIAMKRDEDAFSDDGGDAPIDVAPPAAEDPADTPEGAYNSPPPLFNPEGESEDVFEDAFAADFSPTRGNTPFIFPGSRQLDQWLPTILIAICLAWLTYLTMWASADQHPTWVGVVRLLILLMTYAGVIFPICLKGVRMAARKLNYELPSGTPLRAFSTFLLPVTIGCAIWLTSGQLIFFLIGAVLGLVAAMPTMWLLFRIRQDDAATSFGYGAGAFGAGIAAAAVLLLLLNLIVVGVVRGTKAEHTLTASPFGPGFTWDGPTLVAKQETTKRPKRGEPVKAPTQGKAFENLPDGPGDATTKPAQTKLVAEGPTKSPTTVDASSLTNIDTSQAVPDAQVQTDLVAQPVKKFEHGPIVTEVTQRLSGEMLAIIYPKMPGKALAVVNKGVRQAEDRLELWSTQPWAAQKSVTFLRGGQSSGHYQLTPDGKVLARLADFPHMSAQAYSFAVNDLIRPFVKVDSAGPPPYLAGFAANNELVMFFPAGASSSVEVWDVNRVKRRMQINVSGLSTEPGYHALSRDGKFLALVLWQQGDTNGRIETYNLATGALDRKIIVDELAWTNQIRCSGVSFTEEPDKVAALFERQEGQGLFLCWAANNDIPLHQHVYPGGLVPENVNRGTFVGPSFVLVDNSRAWLLYGASIFDTATGKLLGDLGLKNIQSQKVVSGDTVLLQQSEGAASALLEVKLDVNKSRRELAAKP